MPCPLRFEDRATASGKLMGESGDRDTVAAGDFPDSDARTAEESEPGAGPLLNDGPLELGERAEDVEDELAAGSIGVDALGQRPEADLAAFEVLDGLDELLHGSG